ncbi:hypothetical protein LAJ55_15110 [Streptococcus pneumoniae]|uniref:hypothetical protein n=1 Tax=Streptococcus pneumoniae TaxID=1313 RepID=UPI001CBF64B6|nr:hypothetical protein [Streptococcus pneumoniae]MBZ4284131.1 hypothetical protein [Streptococcus pneumoniae]
MNPRGEYRDLEFLGFQDEAEEADRAYELRCQDIARVERERYEEWLAEKKRKELALKARKK